MASFGPVEKDWTVEMKKAYSNEDQLKAIDRMRQLIDQQPNDEQSFSEFQSLLRVIAPKNIESEDSGEGAILDEDPLKLLRRFPISPQRREADRAGLLDAGSRGLGVGAQEAARVATDWKMKDRAGVVGERGLGAVLRRLPANLRIHLIGTT